MVGSVIILEQNNRREERGICDSRARSVRAARARSVRAGRQRRSAGGPVNS
jgi:hypothetical protein